MEIKEEYNKMFSVTLASDISQHFKGHFAKFLLALIKGEFVFLKKNLQNLVHLVSTSCADSRSTDLNIKSQPTENFKK